MNTAISIKFSSLVPLIAAFLFTTDRNLLVLGAKEDLRIGQYSIKTLEFMPEGRDFYQKFIRLSKPVLLKSSLKNSVMDKTIQNITNLLQKEVFEVNDKKMPFPYWYNQSMAEKKELDLRADKTMLMEEIILPIMLHCKEYKLAYDQFILTIIPAQNVMSYPKHAKDEMMLFSFGNNIKVELYDKRYSAELLANVESGKAVHNVNFITATLSEGDILYVPKYWWIRAEASGKPNTALKLFFNLMKREDQQHETDTKRGVNLQDIKEHQDYLSKLPATIDCTRRTLSLRHVLHINESDPKTLQLRLPKKAERPRDAVLQSGYTMPVLGLGTALLNEKTTGIVKDALDLGYRLIDTAQGYPGSEAGIAQALLESLVPRSEVFIVTKLHPRYLGYNSTIKAIEMSLKSLNVSYIDLFLIHAMECDDFLLKCEEGEPYGTWQESWRAMEHAHREGKIRSLGVSNFKLPDLRELQKLAEIPVSVVQNWFDPIHQDIRIRKFCSDANIRYMGYSTLGGIWMVLGLDKNPILTSSLLTDLSTHYDYFVSSLVLSWAIHHNVTVIPRTTNKNHLAQNLRALDMKLSEIDISEIDSMATIFEEVLQDMQNEEPQNNEPGNEHESISDDKKKLDSHDLENPVQFSPEDSETSTSRDNEEPILEIQEGKDKNENLGNGVKV